MKIAIIGTGIAGNVVGHHLHRHHEITMFEQGSHVGGHTHTHTIEHAGERLELDTGFIVFNDWTYPNFNALLTELGVPWQASTMSFSVRNLRSGLEYNGTSLNSLFAQRRNLVRPSFHRMVRDILRFNREAPALLDDSQEIELGEYLAAKGYSAQFVRDYLLPMGAAIWSTDPAQMMAFPARFFVRFFHNHGMLSVDDRPQWRVIRGGSARYVEKLTAPFRDRIRLNCPVDQVRRLADGVLIKARDMAAERFDHVFMACHADQALALLADASAVEREVIGAMPYQRNEAVLHTDTSLLPRTRRAWAAWNYQVPVESRSAATQGATLTYNMNMLQGLDSPHTYCVSLNCESQIDPAKIIRRIRYDHPLYTRAAVAAQDRHGQVCTGNRTYFCGAYWGFGFHEDGVVSALKALQEFDKANHEKRHLSRVA